MFLKSLAMPSIKSGKSLFVFCISLFIMFIASCTKREAVSRPDYAIMAYYVPGDLPANKLPLDKLTHIIFSFTRVIDNQMAFKDPRLEARLTELVSEKKQNPDLKVMVACGGWTGSKGFSDMALTEETRDIFVKSVIAFLEEYRLDGLDIDWEYPALPGDNNPYRAEDTQNFTLLMKSLKEAMNRVNKDWVLTFAAAGWDNYFDHIELNEVMKYADYINLMTYDFVGENTPYTAHHTNLGLIDSTEVKNSPARRYADSLSMKLDLRSAAASVNYCIDHQVDPTKIVIGGAFYGKIWKGVPGANNGLYQLNKGFYGYAKYKEIKAGMLNKNGYQYYWDSIAKAPYLYNQKDSLFVSFDDEKSIAQKTQYVKDMHLGGIMFWQLSQDSDDFDLVNTIFEQGTK